jgi:hypothetical protein
MFERMMSARPKFESHAVVNRRDPQTLSYAMADSPAGLGAWLWEHRESFVSKAVAEERTDLRRWTVFDHGGHFAPVGRPEAVVDELRAFFRELR